MVLASARQQWADLQHYESLVQPTARGRRIDLGGPKLECTPEGVRCEFTVVV